MNSIEIEAARQEMLKRCKGLTTNTLDFGFFKEVKIDDEYSAVVFADSVSINNCAIAIFKITGSGRGMIMKKECEGKNARMLTSNLVNQIFQEFEAQINSK